MIYYLGLSGAGGDALNVQTDMLIDKIKQLELKIQRLETEKESMCQEVLLKDAKLEELSLSVKNFENIQKEIKLMQDNYEEAQRELQNTSEQQLQLKTDEIQQLKDMIQTLQVNHKEELLKNQVEELQSESKIKDKQIKNLHENISRMSTELAMKKADCATIEDLLKAHNQGQMEEKANYEGKLAELFKTKQELKDYKVSNNKLTNDLKEAQEKIKELQKTNKSQQDKLIETEKIENETVAELKKLKQLINKSSEETVQLNNINEELRRKYSSIQDQFDGKLKECDKLALELETIKNLHDQVNKEREKMVKDSVMTQEDFEKNRNTMCQELKEKSQEIIELQKNMALLKQEKDLLITENTQQLNIKLNESENSIKELKTKLEVLENNLNNERKRSAQLDDNLTIKANEYKMINSALETNTQMMEKLQNEYKMKIDHCQELETELKVSQNKTNEEHLKLTEIQAKFNSLQTKCDSILEQNKLLENNLLTIHNSHNEMQAKFNTLNQEFNDREKRFKEEQQQFQDKELKTQFQVEELQQKLAQQLKYETELKESCERMQTQIQKQNDEIAILEKKSVQEQLALGDYQRQLENMQNKNDGLMKQYQQLQSDITNLRTSSTDTNAEVLKLSREIECKQQAYDALMDSSNTERCALNGKLEAADKHLETVCHQLETVTAEMSRLQNDYQEREKSLKEQQQQNSKLELDYSNLMRKCEQNATKCKDLEKQNAKLRSELTTVQNDAAAANAEVLRLNGELMAKQKSLQNMSDSSDNKHNSLRKQMEEMQQNLQEKENSLKTLREKLVEQEEQSQELVRKHESALKIIEEENNSQLQDLKQAGKTERENLIQSYEEKLLTSEQNKLLVEEKLALLTAELDLQQKLRSKAETESTRKQTQWADEKAAQQNIRKQLESALKEAAEYKSQCTEQTSLIDSLKSDLQKQIEDRQKAETEIKINFEHELQKLTNALQLEKAECFEKTNRLHEDQNKIVQMKEMLKAVSESNANLLKTNEELANSLESIEREKCEITNIFNLFEMESDENLAKLVDKVSLLKKQTDEAEKNLRAKELQLNEHQKRIAEMHEKLQKSEDELAEMQMNLLEKNTKIEVLQQSVDELKRLNTTLQEKADEINQDSYKTQLEEYKSLIEDIDLNSMKKSDKLNELLQLNRQLHEKNEIDHLHIERLNAELLRLQNQLIYLERSSPLKSNIMKQNGETNSKQTRLQMVCIQRIFT